MGEGKRNEERRKKRIHEYTKRRSGRCISNQNYGRKRKGESVGNTKKEEEEDKDEMDEEQKKKQKWSEVREGKYGIEVGEKEEDDADEKEDV